MGRRKEKTVTFVVFIFLLFFNQNLSYSQTKISGFVTNGNNSSLYSVSIILKDTLNNSILNYTFSNKEGKYTLKTNKTGKFNLTFSSLGFESKIIPIEIKEGQKEIIIDVVLKEKSFERI